MKTTTLASIALLGVGAFLFFTKTTQGKVLISGVPKLPPALEPIYTRLLSEGRDPDAMSIAADRLSSYGYDYQASELRRRANALRMHVGAVGTSMPGVTR